MPVQLYYYPVTSLFRNTDALSDPLPSQRFVSPVVLPKPLIENSFPLTSCTRAPMPKPMLQGHASLSCGSRLQSGVAKIGSFPSRSQPNRVCLKSGRGTWLSFPTGADVTPRGGPCLEGLIVLASPELACCCLDPKVCRTCWLSNVILQQRKRVTLAGDRCSVSAFVRQSSMKSALQKEQTSTKPWR